MFQDFGRVSGLQNINLGPSLAATCGYGGGVAVPMPASCRMAGRFMFIQSCKRAQFENSTLLSSIKFS